MKNLYNPYEIAFCGYSNTGKTTLICQLIKLLKNKFSIGYIKSDAHKFQLDQEGKDTYNATKSGAILSSIHNQTNRAIIENKPSDYFWGKTFFLDYDFIFIEGYKKMSNIKKIIFLDDQNQILSSLNKEDILAFIGKNLTNKIDKNYPYFHRDDITGIKTFILQHFYKKSQKIKINGLILGGGASQRMGTDKCNISYKKDQSITRQMADVIRPFCKNIYFSCRSNQQLNDDISSISLLYDSLLNVGPLGGMISAFEYSPSTAWLIIACDLPYIEKSTIETLFKNYNPYNYATAFKSEYDNFPEPLCTLYSPKSLSRFYQLLATGEKCPRKMLINSSITMIKQLNTHWLDNANTPEEATIIKQNFKL